MPKLGTMSTCTPRTVRVLPARQAALHAEASRQVYNTAGRAGRAGSTHAAQGSTATYGAYGGSYYGSPKVRTGWSNFRYRQKTYGTNSELLPDLTRFALVGLLASVLRSNPDGANYELACCCADCQACSCAWQNLTGLTCSTGLAKQQWCMPVNTNKALVDTAPMAPFVFSKVTACAHQQAAPGRSSWGSIFHSQKSKLAGSQAAAFSSRVLLAARVLQMADGAVAAFRMPFGAFLRGMTRHDGYFHALMAGTAIAGFLLMNSAGESLWDYLNRGVRQPCAVDKAGMVVCLPLQALSVSSRHSKRWVVMPCMCLLSWRQLTWACALQKLYSDMKPDNLPARQVICLLHLKLT